MAFPGFGNSPFFNGQSPFNSVAGMSSLNQPMNTLGPTPWQPISIQNPIQCPGGGQPYGPLNYILGGQGQGQPIPMQFQGHTYPQPQQNPSFVPGGERPVQFQSQGSNGPLNISNPCGQSPLAMDHLRRSGNNNFPSFNTGSSHGHGQLFRPTSNHGFAQQQHRLQSQPPPFQNVLPKWPESVPQGPSHDQSGLPMVSGQFALIDTGALAKLLQDHARSTQQIPVSRLPNRFEDIKPDVSGPFFKSTEPSSQYNYVASRRNPAYQPVDWTLGQGSAYQYPYRPPSRPEPPKQMCTRQGNYYVDFVQDVGQFRPNAPQQWSTGPSRSVPNPGFTVPRDVNRVASYRPCYYDERSHSPQNTNRFSRPGQSFSFKPAPQSVTPDRDWKKLGLKSVNSMIEPEDEPLVDQRRTFSDYGRHYHNPSPPKLAPFTGGPPRQSGASSFSDLVQARVGVPVPHPIRNLSFRPQREDEFVANLSHRLSQRNISRNVPIPTFNPYLPEEAVKKPQEVGNLEVQELFRSKPPMPSRIPIPARTTTTIAAPATSPSDPDTDEGWESICQGHGQTPRRNRITLEVDGNSSILDKALSDAEPADRQGNRTRSRRARSKMTYSTQERNRCRVTLTRDKYYCRPDIAELDALMDDDGHCYVTNFEVGHLEWGKVIFDGTIDVAGINIDTSINIEHKVVILYRDAGDFPPIGHGLNRPATVTLTKVWYNNPLTQQEVRDPSKLQAMNFEKILKESVQQTDAEFVAYDAENGNWTFKVPYFVAIAAKPPTRPEQGEQGTQDVKTPNSA